LQANWLRKNANFYFLQLRLFKHSSDKESKNKEAIAKSLHFSEKQPVDNM